MPDVVITGAVRTSIGKFVGELSAYSAVELGAQGVAALCIGGGSSVAVAVERVAG